MTIVHYLFSIHIINYQLNMFNYLSHRVLKIKFQKLYEFRIQLMGGISNRI